MRIKPLGCVPYFAFSAYSAGVHSKDPASSTLEGKATPMENPSRLLLTFSSPGFTLLEGQGCLFRLDVLKDELADAFRDQGWEAMAEVFRTDQSNLEQKVELNPVSLQESGPQELKVSSPGTFELLLAGLKVLRQRDRQEFQVPHYVDRVSITASDIEKGTVEVKINSKGVFRLTVFEGNGNPKPVHKVSFWDTATCFQVPTDEKGQITFLNDPREYSISPGEEPGVTVRISPVD